MLRTVLVAIAMIGLSAQARAEGDALHRALFGYQHDTAAQSLSATAEVAAPLDAEPDPLCGTTVEGELVLDRDVSCTHVAFWIGSDSTLDLNGFTVEGALLGLGANVTIRNGTVARGHIECDGCLIEDVRVVDGTSFVVDVGLNATIRHCDFSGNEVAVDLYYGPPNSYVVIEDSTFENNDIAINNAKHNYTTASGNVFRKNRVGIRLYAELGDAVSFNTVEGNEFVENDVGVAFVFYRCYSDGQPTGPGYEYCHDGNVVDGNAFTANHASGVLFGGLPCSSYGLCTEVDASIEDNLFSGNGFASTQPFPSVDDGITVIGPPDVVDGVTIAGNFAVSNQDLGIEAPGAVDGGGNLASGNGNPLQCVGVACGSAWPQIDVAPSQYDFGQVDFGTRSTQIVTISNTGGSDLTVTSVELLPGADPAFEVDDAPALPAAVPPGGSVDVALAFEPTVEGLAGTTLRIASDDHEEPTVDVPLSGVGVPFDEQAMALLDDLDAAVASGDVRGTHRGTLGALRNLIESSGDLLERGWTNAACAQLEAARLRADGEFPPPDFVRGSGVPALAAEIADLRANLGCDLPPPPQGGPPGCGRGFEMAALVPPLAWLRRRRRPGRRATHRRA
jgi:HYDIN/CFA65/VesB-like, Ig-like domain/Periplasmic copper-binding protein (NosD)